MHHPSAKKSLARRLLGVLPSLAVIGLAAFAVSHLMATGTEAKRTKPERSARLVEVTTLAATDHPVRIEAWGTVQAARRVTLQPQVSGEVLAVGDGFEPGARVRAGDLLARIDPADYELAVRQSRSELTRARAELAQEQGRGAVAEQEFRLMQGEVTAPQRRLMLREPQLETARAAVTSAEAALERAELDLARTQIRAPFNAVVLERGADVGTRVSAGTTLATLAGTDTYWVELAVPAASLRWLEVPGAKVRLYQEKVWGNDVYREGRVIRLRGDLDEKGRMARLLVAVPDPLALEHPGRPSLLLGAFVRAELEGRRIEDALAVERGWLRDGDALWLLDGDGTLAIRPVEVLYRGAEEVYVRGVAPGERLVTSDLAVPAAGMPLRAAGEPSPAPDVQARRAPQ